MATDAYYQWVKAGRSFAVARPIRELVALARSSGVAVLGVIGSDDERHLQNVRPEDHCPYSFTAWPLPLPGYWVCACDLANGPYAGRLLADCKAGRAPWVKYINYGGHHYDSRRGWAPEPSSDEHLHVSCRSDWLDRSTGAYNPFVAASSTVEAPGMAEWTQDQINEIMFTLTSDSAGGAIHVRDALLRQSVGALAADVAELKARPAAALSSADRDALVAALKADIGSLVRESLRDIVSRTKLNPDG